MEILNLATINVNVQKTVEFPFSVKTVKSVVVSLNQANYNGVSYAVTNVTTSSFVLNGMRTAGSVGNVYFYWIAVVDY